MKVIFLDIDGVLAGHLTPRRKLDPVGISLLNKLLEVEPDTKLVISSSWRILYSHEEMLKKLRDEGFQGKVHDDWRTPDIGYRGDEIDVWLARNPEVTAYVCMDDESDYHPHQSFIKINRDNGISMKDFLQASAILFCDENAWLKAKREMLAQVNDMHPFTPDAALHPQKPMESKP